MRPPAFWLPFRLAPLSGLEAHANLVSRTAIWANAITPSAFTRRCSTRIRRTCTRSAGLAALSNQANDFDTALEFHVRLIDLGECSADVLYNTGLV
jgi:hypothetical protein